MKRVLVLGGTAEARDLAQTLLSAGGWDVVLSLAGVADPLPLPPGITLRQGGFGGAVGLHRFLQAEGFAALVDATHPFAQRMPDAARLAARDAGLPRLRLLRPPWTPRPAEDWQLVDDLGAALALLPAGARAVWATGAGSAGLLRAGRDDVAIALRSIADPGPLPGHIRLIRARPPFDLAAEMALLRDFGATHLVTKNSGGAAGRSKIDAAAALGLGLIVQRRPAPPPGPRAESTAQALAWLERI